MMDYKILINQNHKLDHNKIQNLKLLKYTNFENKDIYIEKKTYEYFLKLKQYLQTKNINIDIFRAYLSEEEVEFYQKNNKIENNKTLLELNEHQTGLCIDIVISLSNSPYQKISELLAKDKNFNPIYNQILDSLSEFGFILRYPKHKEQITGVCFQAGHIRYVGVRSAQIIYNENLTLEEYYHDYNLDGVIVINKPKNITSHDVVDFVSKKLDTKKVGHTGTLDPLATGVLVLTLGRYTKLTNEITSQDKEYIATVKVGIETDTLDITGKVLNEEQHYNLNNLEQTINSFQKTYLQEVPIYSAVKVNGKKLYEYARNNQKVSLPKKEVTINKIKLLSKSKDSFTFSCSVSKGTYIRSLIRDIGKNLNCPMTMTDLKRTRQGYFCLEQSCTLEDITNKNYKLLKVEDIFAYPVIEISSNEYQKVKNGAELENKYNIQDKVILKYNNSPVAIYHNKNSKLYVWKML